MIITDFAKVSAPKKCALKEDGDTKSALSRIEFIGDIGRVLENDLLSSSNGRQLREERDERETEYNDLRWKMFKRDLVLPTKFLQDMKKDPLSLAAASPQIELKELRKLADILGFVLLPYRYFNVGTLDKESEKVRGAVNAFHKVMKEKFQIYVLCPVEFYDVKRHVDNERDTPIYAGTACQQAFIALSMALPMFRTMKQQIDGLSERTSALEGQVQNMNQEIGGLQARVADLQESMNIQLRSMAIEVATQRKNMAKAIKRIETLEIICARDPLMVAVQPKVSIKDGTGLAVTGPCWGEDFDDIVVGLLGLKKHKGQREKLGDHAEQWYHHHYRSRSRWN